MFYNPRLIEIYMTSADDIQSMIQGINQQITEIVSDIKSNTSKKNIQTTEDNKLLN